MNPKRLQPKKQKKFLIWSNMPENEYCDCKNVECNCAEMSLNDERDNLNINLHANIVAIADLGLWNGRKIGYKILGNNLNSIFSILEDYNEFFSDGYTIRSTNIHHDGRNHVEYRLIKQGKNIDNILGRIRAQQTVTRSTILQYTSSLHPYVAKIYGW
ncbi:hypothetical protein D3C71_1445950 [compost metagenome]